MVLWMQKLMALEYSLPGLIWCSGNLQTPTLEIPYILNNLCIMPDARQTWQILQQLHVSPRPWEEGAHGHIYTTTHRRVSTAWPDVVEMTVAAKNAGCC